MLQKICSKIIKIDAHNLLVLLLLFFAMFFVFVLPNLRGLAPLKEAAIEHPQLTSASRQKEGLGR